MSKKKWYVYLLCDPDTQEPFYVGKGTKNRMYQHEQPWHAERQNPLKLKIIDNILAQGKQVLKKKVAEFDDEQDAYIYEMAMISVYASSLTNIRYVGGGYLHSKKTRSKEVREERIPTHELVMENVWTLDQTAKYFQLPPERVLRFLKKGLPYAKIENHFLFDSQRVKAWTKSLEGSYKSS